MMHSANSGEKAFYDVNQARRPVAQATLRGSKEYSDIFGRVLFFASYTGVIVKTIVHGLPFSDEKCANPFLAYHLHAGESCSGNEEDPFADADGHYNPDDCPHPSHAGDFPPLINCGGYAYSEFFTDKLKPDELIGKTLIIHRGYDDFTTQPSGNAGEKMACGLVFPFD